VTATPDPTQRRRHPARRPAYLPRTPVTVAVVAAAVLVLAVLGSVTSRPRFGPFMDGAPEARVAATATIDDAAARIVFSDRVTVLATGRADGCATESGEGFFSDPVGYFCTMGWMATVVVPDARTREEVAGAIDAEIAAMDVTPTSTLAESLVMRYPSVRDGATLYAGGAAGDARLHIEATQVRGTWTAPRIPGGDREVSSAGDLDSVTAADVAATGADEVVTVLVTTTYWDTSGRSTTERDPGPALALEHYAEGTGYRFDVALPDPVADGEACAGDAAVDPSSVVSVQEPFPRLTFALGPDAGSPDMQRVRDCLTGRLRSGAIAVLTPDDPY
jgi:hypothetical protein